MRSAEPPCRDKERTLIAEALGVDWERLNFARKRKPPLIKRPPAPPPINHLNTTDPDSVLVSRKKFSDQVYNCQAAVDSENQIAIAGFISSDAHDRNNLTPAGHSILKNLKQLPRVISADCGYHNSWELEDEIFEQVEMLVPPEKIPKKNLKNPKPLAQKMRKKLDIKKFRTLYNQRSSIVEPLFGNIKANLGFNKFFTRGIEKVQSEWRLVLTTHNLLKLFRRA